MSISRETPDWQGIQDTRLAIAIARAECGHTSVLLESIGFQYSYQLTEEEAAADELAEEEHQAEEYLGWVIYSSPIFVAEHKRSRNGWVAIFEENENVERVKFLIRKGLEVDLAKAMEVSQ